MATGGSEAGDIRVTGTCSVCLEDFEEPEVKQFRCFHTFCLPCLSELVTRTGAMEETTESDFETLDTPVPEGEEAGRSGVSVSCPTCVSAVPVPRATVSAIQGCGVAALPGPSDSSPAQSPEHSQVRQQLHRVEDVLRKLTEQERRLEQERRAMEDSINVRYATLLRHAADARDACCHGLREACDNLTEPIHSSMEEAQQTRDTLQRQLASTQPAPESTAMLKAVLFLMEDVEVILNRDLDGCSLLHHHMQDNRSLMADTLQSFMGKVTRSTQSSSPAQNKKLIESFRFQDHTAALSPLASDSKNLNDLYEQFEDLASQVTLLQCMNSQLSQPVVLLSNAHSKLSMEQSALQREVTAVKEKNIQLATEQSSLQRKVAAGTAEKEHVCAKVKQQGCQTDQTYEASMRKDVDQLKMDCTQLLLDKKKVHSALCHLKKSHRTLKDEIDASKSQVSCFMFSQPDSKKAQTAEFSFGTIPKTQLSYSQEKMQTPKDLELLGKAPKGTLNFVTTSQSQISCCEQKVQTQQTPQQDNRKELTGAFSLGTVTSSLGTKTSSLGTETSSLGTETSSLGTKTSSLGTETSSLGTNTSSLGTRTSSLGTKTSSLGTNTSSLGTKTFSLGTKTSSLGTKTSSLGTKTSSLGTETSSLGTKTFSLGTETSSLGTRTSSLGTETFSLTETSSLGTETSSLGTESQSQVFCPQQKVQTKKKSEKNGKELTGLFSFGTVPKKQASCLEQKMPLAQKSDQDRNKVLSAVVSLGTTSTGQVSCPQHKEPTAQSSEQVNKKGLTGPFSFGTIPKSQLSSFQQKMQTAKNVEEVRKALTAEYGLGTTSTGQVSSPQHKEQTAQNLEQDNKGLIKEFSFGTASQSEVSCLQEKMPSAQNLEQNRKAQTVGFSFGTPSKSQVSCFERKVQTAQNVGFSFGTPSKSQVSCFERKVQTAQNVEQDRKEVTGAFSFGPTAKGQVSCPQPMVQTAQNLEQDDRKALTGAFSFAQATETGTLHQSSGILEDVFSKTSWIVCKGIPATLNEEAILRERFSHFGKVKLVHPMPAQRQALIKFETQESASRARRQGTVTMPGHDGPLSIFFLTSATDWPLGSAQAAGQRPLSWGGSGAAGAGSAKGSHSQVDKATDF